MTLKPSQLAPFLRDMWTNHPQEPVLLTGRTGLGKSAITKAVARSVFQDGGYQDIRLAGKEPTDLVGAMVPVNFEKKPARKTRSSKTAEEGTEKTAELFETASGANQFITPGITTFFPPADMPYENVPGFQKEGVLALDEFLQAPPSVLNLAYSLVYDRMAGQNKLREGWRLIAMGNLREEKTFQEEIPEPLRGRFTHVQLEQDLNDYINFYLEDIPGEFIIPAFLQFTPAALHEADPDGTGGFPCPRSWSRSGRYLQAKGDFVEAKVAGSIGEKTFATLSAFMQIMTDQNQKIPADKALQDPSKLDVNPANPGLAWAHATRIAGHVREQVLAGNHKVFGQGMKFFIHPIWKQNLETGRLGLRMMKESLGALGTELAAKDHNLLSEHITFYGSIALFSNSGK
jgi:hypothetical protein